MVRGVPRLTPLCHQAQPALLRWLPHPFSCLPPCEPCTWTDFSPCTEDPLLTMTCKAVRTGPSNTLTPSLPLYTLSTPCCHSIFLPVASSKGLCSCSICCLALSSRLSHDSPTPAGLHTLCSSRIPFSRNLPQTTALSPHVPLPCFSAS